MACHGSLRVTGSLALALIGLLILPAPPAQAAAAATPPAVQIADLVTANQILFDQGVVDAFGHVSVRSATRPDRFFMARNRAPSDVVAADILEFTLEGEPATATNQLLYSERFIHSEIYKARPDLMAVVHGHSYAVVTLSAVQNVQLRPVMHFAGFIGDAAPTFEIRSVAGEASDLFIRNGMLGAALARTMGQGNIVLMRGHGSAIAGTTLPMVVHRAVYAEVNARMQIDAMKLGTVNYLSPGEVRVTQTTPNYQRAWDFWKAEAAARRR
jgi:HCOMODA/2-hydroxy-3-carboxy-muconic semialdehyde decarboxylase